MSNIRRQSIIASFVVYAGFAVGFFNTYLFTRQGGFTKEQFGLTAIFMSAAIFMHAIANAGRPAVITKFYPYYKAHLPPEKNDLLTRSLLIPLLGFFIVLAVGLAFKQTIITRMFNNSPELLDHFYWIFPFGLGYTLFMVLDAYSWQLGKAVLSNLLKEVMFRGFITVLIILTTLGLIQEFETFIGLYAMVYLTLAIALMVYLKKQGHFRLVFQKSHVTRRFGKRIKALVGYIWGGGLVFSLASVIDTIFVAAILPNGMGAAGVFTFGQYITSLIQAPQRAVISAATGPLSAAWRAKDMDKIKTIYHRSSINQLLFACAMFLLIWLNFEDGIRTFRLQSDYLEARWVFFFLGLTRIVDMGTGVNSQIIGTSTYWRFEFTSGLVLLGLMMPLNFFLTREYGIVGPGVANLISFVVYNAMRYIFLWRKFGMQPFDRKTAYALLVSAACFVLAFYPFRHLTGLHWMALRSLAFLLPFLFLVLRLRISPDLLPVWQTVKKRLRIAGA